ncbi:MAG: hypothetical protein AAFY17_12760, partial [Cyanobacteria bacterium J06642_11]
IQDDTFQLLQSFSNVVITAHQAFFTQEALHNIAVTTLSNISHIEAGQACINDVSIAQPTFNQPNKALAHPPDGANTSTPTVPKNVPH